jgi:hypothetical protein
MDSRQGELFSRAVVYRIKERRCAQLRQDDLAEALEPAGVVLACGACQHAYEPLGESWQVGDVCCPRCGGWTMIAQIVEPRGQSS